MFRVLTLMIVIFELVAESKRTVLYEEVIRIIEVAIPRLYPMFASSYTLKEIPGTDLKLMVLLIKQHTLKEPKEGKQRNKVALIATVRGVEPTHNLLMGFAEDKLKDLKKKL